MCLQKENKILQFENHENYNCEIVTDTGKTYRVYANWLHNNNLDQWQGWSCQAGTNRLYIDKNFNVYGGDCRNDYLGHAVEGFEILNGTICRRSTCTGCTDDLVIGKSHE